MMLIGGIFCFVFYQFLIEYVIGTHYTSMYLGRCQTSDNTTGICLLPHECPDLIKYYWRNMNISHYYNSCRVRHQRYKGMVCCTYYSKKWDTIKRTVGTIFNIPSNIKNTTQESHLSQNINLISKLLTPEEGCGHSTAPLPRIINGMNAPEKAFPWMALLGYQNELDKIEFKCGGVLVTTRHVLTAAHCTKKSLKFIRLGEYDISSEIEGEHIDVDVIQTIRHPNFDRHDYHSDIALLLMDKNVDISDSIRPICIPITGEILTKSFVEYQPFIAGWGYTEINANTSDILQMARVQILNNSECKRLYAAEELELSSKQFNEGIICAGSEDTTDSCQGDSGGPLMLPQQFSNGSYSFYLFGIVSYGIECGRIGVPSVYTSLQYFSDWVQEKVSETSIYYIN